MKHVFMLSGVQSRVFPFSLVLIHCVHPYCSSQVIDEVQHTTCMILRTQPSYTPATVAIVHPPCQPPPVATAVSTVSSSAELKCALHALHKSYFQSIIHV